jgi:hypothetical protein
MNEAPFSTNFVLHRNGLRCQHTVRSGESIESHVGLVDAALAAFAAAGHTITEAGLEAGQESHDCCGYVVMTTSKGDKVLYAYTEYFEKVVHGGAIYQEKWADLPFKVDTSKLYNAQGRPERDWAKQQGYFIPQKFKIIVERTEKLTDAGKNIWKFVSAVAEGVAPTTVGAHQQTVPVAASGDADALCNKIIAHLTEKVHTAQQLVDAALRAFARRSQLGEECWQLVQKNIRARIVLLVNEASHDVARDELEAAVRAIAKVLPDGYADDVCREIAASKSTDIAF